MLRELALTDAYRVTPTGLYLISTAYQDKRNVQFAFRALGLGDDPPLLLIGIQDKNFSRGVIQQSGEFVINVCSQNQLHAVDKSRDLSGRNVDDKIRRARIGNAPGIQRPSAAGRRLPRQCRMQVSQRDGSRRIVPISRSSSRGSCR
jgi:flavin reductase (DIM6/NTAB) family NADH-FMN oxidoreductase RutF